MYLFDFKIQNIILIIDRHAIILLLVQTDLNQGVYFSHFSW